MKEKIVAKMEDHIQRILDKPEITGEEYMTLRYRLEDIRLAERRARRALEAGQNRKTMEDLIHAAFGDLEVSYDGM